MNNSEYMCDKCEVEMEIFDIGILGNIEDECNFTSKMICLCKPCTIEREKELKKELQLIQYAIKKNIKNR
jgi:hypothetical protein